MNFSNWFSDDSFFRIEMLEVMMNRMLGPLTGNLGEYSKLLRQRAELTGESHPEQSDTLKGCDALAHSLHLQDVIGMPVADVTFSAFKCGCILGILGLDEIMGSMCREHVEQFTGAVDADDYSINTIKKAKYGMLDRWIATYRDHWNDKHDWFDRDSYNWTVADEQEKSRHDDIARKLLDD